MNESVYEAGQDASGQLATEDGPWANDTVTLTYTNGWRGGLSLQQPNASDWTQSYIKGSVPSIDN